eukprot:2317269-Pyramimonas_sp.AAC.1
MPATVLASWPKASVGTLGAATAIDAFGVDAALDNVAIAFGALQGRRKGRSVYGNVLFHSRSRM